MDGFAVIAIDGFYSRGDRRPLCVEAIKQTISLPLDTTDTAELLPEVMAAQDPISLDTKNTKFMMVLMPPSCYRKPWPQTIFLPK